MKMAALAGWLGNTQSHSLRRKFLCCARNRSEENSQIRETLQMTFENITISQLAPEREEREREAGYFCVAEDKSGWPIHILPNRRLPAAFVQPHFIYLHFYSLRWLFNGLFGICIEMK